MQHHAWLFITHYDLVYRGNNLREWHEEDVAVCIIRWQLDINHFMTS